MRSCDLRGNQTVSDCEDLRPPERHRADAGMEATPRRWRGIYTPSSRCVGRPKFDFHTGPAATASSLLSKRRVARSSRRSAPAWRTRTTRSTSAARRRRRCTRRSRRRGELFAARGGAAPPRGLSIEVLLYSGRCWGWVHALAGVSSIPLRTLRARGVDGARLVRPMPHSTGLVPRSRLCV